MSTDVLHDLEEAATAIDKASDRLRRVLKDFEGTSDPDTGEFIPGAQLLYREQVTELMDTIAEECEAQERKTPAQDRLERKAELRLKQRNPLLYAEFHKLEAEINNIQKWIAAKKQVVSARQSVLRGEGLSAPHNFNRMMVLILIGHDPILRRRFSEGERWTFVAGVLSMAASSPVRSWLFVAENVPATAEDIADRAGVPVKRAESTLEKCRKFSLVEWDSGLECEWVPDFEKYNPPPKKDTTAAERMARMRANKKKSVTAVTPPVTPAVTACYADEVEVEVEVEELPPLVPHSDFADWVAHHEQVTGMTPPRAGTAALRNIERMFGARRDEGYSLEDLRAATVGAFNDKHRRENGYYGCESVLRPQKVHGLVELGRRGPVLSDNLAVLKALDDIAGGAA